MTKYCNELSGGNLSIENNMRYEREFLQLISPRLRAAQLSCLQMDFDVLATLKLVIIGQQENSTLRSEHTLLEVERMAASAKFDLLGVREDQDFWLVIELDIIAHIVHVPYQLLLSRLTVDAPACGSLGKLRANE